MLGFPAPVGDLLSRIPQLAISTEHARSLSE